MKTSEIIIFGKSDFALVLKEYLIRDGYNFYGFAVTDTFYDNSYENGEMIIKESELHRHREKTILIAVGFSSLNSNRERIYKNLKQQGFIIGNYISKYAIVWPQSINGDNIIILDNCIIEPFVRIHSNTVLWCSVNISHHSIVSENCFIAPRANIAGNVFIGYNCFLGINSTIFDHIKIGNNTLIGGGVTIYKDIENNMIIRK